MAQSAARRVYVPQKIMVQMPRTQENPNGYVRTLNEGWNDLDEELAAHPVISRLVPQSREDQVRADRMLEAERKRDEAIAQAHSAFHAEMTDITAEQAEERQAAAEAYGQRAEEAAQRGVAFNEPHPDPATATAAARTASPSHFVPSEVIASRPDDETKEGGQQSLPTRRERLQQSQEARAQQASGDSADETGDADKDKSDKPTARTRG